MPGRRKSSSGQIDRLESQLDAPDLHSRVRALRELKHLSDTGGAVIEKPRPWVNMHCHTFYSYNAHGFSPCRVAWEAHRRGLAAAGIVDFDVLDGLDEAIEAGDALHFRFTAGIESRVYVREFNDLVLNSPNEPAIAYYMGQGFVNRPAKGSDAERTLMRMAECAQARNKAVLERVNDYLGDVAVHYEKDVIPLTASGNVTERHMIEAYDAKAQQVIPDRAARARFWAAKLRMSSSDVERIMRDKVLFRDMMRKQLIKYGSPGYVTPEPGSFPAHEEAVAMIRACGAMPMYAWLDGTNAGEEDVELLLDFFCSAGQAGINVIPDRNWNVRDPEEKAIKLERLNQLVAAARNRHLPISVGTEMNRSSQPLVDHFDTPELRPHRKTFLEGALIIWGHSLLLRHGGFGYLSPQADAAFGSDAPKKNAFFREVGSRPPPHGADLKPLRSASRAGDAPAVLRALPERRGDPL